MILVASFVATLAALCKVTLAVLGAGLAVIVFVLFAAALVAMLAASISPQ